MEARTLRSLYEDVVKTAHLSEISEINDDKLMPVLRAYEQYFTTSGVGFRTTTQPVEKRDLDVAKSNYDPFPLAMEQGFIAKEGHPIEELIPELQSKFHFIGFGVDVGVKEGFKKIWPFPQPGISMDDIFKLNSLPGSVKNYADYFQKYGLGIVSLFALDYLNRTTNLYIMAKDKSKFTADKIAGQIEDLGFTLPSQEELDINATNVCVYYTFSWDSEKIECMSYVLAGPVARMPLHWHPLFGRFVEEAPTAVEKRMFTYNTAYAEKGDYYKIEVDYTATMAENIKHAAIVAS